MNYTVHVFVEVRIPVDVEAETQLEAIEKAEKVVEEYQDVSDVPFCDFTDLTTGYMVDEENDPEYEQTTRYAPDGKTIEYIVGDEGGNHAETKP